MDQFINVSGDLHIERQQYGLPLRFNDNLSCINFIVDDTCQQKNCIGLILTGDTFNKKTILPKYQILFKSVYDRLVSARKEFLAIDGNHDGSDASWLDTVNPVINVSGKLTPIGGKLAGFYSFQDRPKLYEAIRPVASKLNFLFLHGRLLELLSWAKAQTTPDYDFSAAELRELGVKNCTIIMGDIHTYGDYYDPIGNNWFIYPGSTEMSEVSEGNVVSERFGDAYDPQKYFVRLFPQRPLGENWERIKLPNRPFLKRVIQPGEDIEYAISQVNKWVEGHPQGILALHYPDSIREKIANYLVQWKEKLLVFSDIPLSEYVSKPLQEMQERDILEIAEKELTHPQILILQQVLENENFADKVKALLDTRS